MENTLNPKITPAIGKERLIALDILRGFATLNILDETIRYLEISRLKADEIFAHGSFVEVTAQRISDIVMFNLSGWFFMGSIALGMMLLSLYTAKVKSLKK